MGKNHEVLNLGGELGRVQAKTGGGGDGGGYHDIASKICEKNKLKSLNGSAERAEKKLKIYMILASIFLILFVIFCTVFLPMILKRKPTSNITAFGSFYGATNESQWSGRETRKVI